MREVRTEQINHKLFVDIGSKLFHKRSHPYETGKPEIIEPIPIWLQIMVDDEVEEGYENTDSIYKDLE